MTRFKLIIEYDGMRFCGWQRQPGLPTVQASIEQALTKLSSERPTVHGCGRTDAGVHARGQVAHFDLDKMLEPYQIRNGLNYYLKDSGIVIVQVDIAPQDFHARFSCVRRYYEYYIVNRPTALALERTRAWHVYYPLNIEEMRKAAKHLIGHHDFTSFRSIHCQGPTPYKTLERLQILQMGECIRIKTQGPSFLHHQVRNMVGTLKLVGQGKWPADIIPEILAAKDRCRAGPTAPPHGLYFIKGAY